MSEQQVTVTVVSGVSADHKTIPLTHPISFLIGLYSLNKHKSDSHMLPVHTVV